MLDFFFTLISASLLFGACTTLTPNDESAMQQRGPATAGFPEFISLDTHVHIRHCSGRSPEAQLQKLFEQDHVEAIFGISNSFVNEPYLMDATTCALYGFKPPTAAQVRQNISILNKQLSALSQKLKSKFYGLCGVNLWWSLDLIEDVVQECLSLPGNIGIKLHFSVNKNILSKSEPEPVSGLGQDLDMTDSSINKFRKLASLVNKTGGVVLIHFANDLVQHPTESYETQNTETELFLDVANHNPNVNFVIAHAGMGQLIGIHGLNFLGNYYSKNPQVKRNIFVDISKLAYQISYPNHVLEHDTPAEQTAYISFWKNNNEVVSALRNFSMQYVLYGSDLSGETEDWLPVLALTLIPNFTEDEKNLIFKKNGHRFLQMLKLQD